MIKYGKVEPTNLFLLQLNLRKVLLTIPRDLPHAGDKNHAYLAINDATWKVTTGKIENNVWKDGELVAKPTHPGDYTATTIAASGVYEKNLNEYNLHSAVRRATKKVKSDSTSKTKMATLTKTHSPSLNIFGPM